MGTYITRQPAEDLGGGTQPCWDTCHCFDFAFASALTFALATFSLEAVAALLCATDCAIRFWRASASAFHTFSTSCSVCTQLEHAHCGGNRAYSLRKQTCLADQLREHLVDARTVVYGHLKVIDIILLGPLAHTRSAVSIGKAGIHADDGVQPLARKLNKTYCAASAYQLVSEVHGGETVV